MSLHQATELTRCTEVPHGISETLGLAMQLGALLITVCVVLPRFIFHGLLRLGERADSAGLIALALAIPLGRLFLIIQLKTRRRCATSRSPAFGLLAEAVDGLPTFRAYGLADRVLADFIELLHIHLRPVYQARPRLLCS